MDQPTDRAGLVTWLRQRVTIAGLDPQLLRLELLVEPDGMAPNADECGDAARDAWHRWEWWFVRCRVTVGLALMPAAGSARWLELGVAGVDRQLEGQLPGRPFVNVWEDCLQLWEGLAEDAVAAASETLDLLQGVRLTWKIDQPAAGSLPGC